MVRLARLFGTRRRIVAGVLVVAVAAAATWWFIGRSDTDAAQATTTATAEVTASTIQDTVTGSGTLESQKSSELSFSSSGTVTSVYVAEGDTVKEGDKLARIDRTSLRAEVTSAQAQLVAAETTAADDSDQSSAQQAANTAAVATAKADLADAKQALKDGVLRAPFSGMVAEVGFEKGDHVGSGSSSSSAGGASAVAGSSGGSASSASSSTTASGSITVITPKRFVVVADVSASDVERLSSGMQAEVTPSGAIDVVFGTVQDVSKVAEAASDGTATFPVTIALTGEQEDLYVGTSVDVSIIVESQDDVLTIPTASITTEGDQAYVQKVSDDGTTKTEVEVGDTYGMTTEIVSGLEEGDSVEYTQTTGRRGGSGGGAGQMPGMDGGFPGGGEVPQMPEGGFPGGGSGFPGGGGGFPGGGQ